MSLEKYLNPEEKILFQVNLKSKENARMDLLGFTQCRVFLFRKLKGRNRIYCDIPLDKITYLEHGWKSRNIFLLILGSVFVVTSFALIMPSFFFFFWFFISVPLAILGLVFIIKGSKQRGYFIVNDEKWKFALKGRDSLEKIEEFVRKIYFAKSSL